MNNMADIARSTLMSLRSRDGPPGTVDPPGGDPPRLERIMAHALCMGLVCLKTNETVHKRNQL